MSEAELKIFDDSKNCTLYTIQFMTESDSEFERFYKKFINDAILNEDLLRIPVG